MALSDVEIWMELQANSLVIDPMPAFEDVAAASIDLHLAPELDAYKPNPGGWKIDLRDANATDQNLCAETLGRPTTKPYTGQFPNQKP
jgi:hypothetical protein